MVFTATAHAAPSHINNQAVPTPPVEQVAEVKERPAPKKKQVKPKKAKAKPQVKRQVAAPIKGNKRDWMRLAGIRGSDYQYVNYIIGRESSWNPCAYNPGRSDCNATPTTACGLPQALPCSKLGANWSDPVVALKWANTYAVTRYGSWANAYNFWQSNSWW